MSSRPALHCPGCGAEYPSSERFCDACSLPLVPAGEPAQPGRAALRARKILPQYAEGPPVRVARTQNQPEAEMVEQLLLDAGIPCLIRRAPGADVPDFLAACAPERGTSTSRAPPA